MQLKTILIIAAVALILSPTLRGRSPSARNAPVILPVAKGKVLPVSLPVQSNDARDLGLGKLLVASRELTDPHFAEAVVLLVHYDAQGVVGLILNRRTHVPLSRVLEDMETAKDRSDPVYLGGPVDPPAMFGLFQSPAKIEGAEHIFGHVYLILSKTLFEQTLSARPDPGVFHVYLGYAGWTSDQLRNEVALGAWFIFPADAGTVFNSDPGSLWQQMIQKTEVKVAEKDRWSHAVPFVEASHERSQSGHRR